MNKSFKIEVTTDRRPNEWQSNIFRFATSDEAYGYLFTQTGYGSNLRKTRICETNEPVNARFHSGLSSRIEVL